MLAENKAGAAPWYQLAYERLTQETPFTFAGPAQLDAPADPRRELRAEPRARRRAAVPAQPLGQHGPGAAAGQRRDRQRLRRRCCAAPATASAIRGQPVNLVAVDFYKRGDLFRVVDTLNRP